MASETETKKQMRQHEMEVEIDATVEQVWEAVSTSQGIASWFAPDVKVEPGVGGSVAVSMGPGMEATSRIEVWEPNQHIRIVMDRAEGAPPSFVDYFVEGRGGSTVMRLVHSGFEASANFDGEFESYGRGWPLYLKIMKHSVEHGVASCRHVMILRMLSESHAEAWEKVQAGIPEMQQGVTKYFNAAHGFCVVEFPERNHALLVVCCDKCGGSSMLTLMALLYGATQAEAEQAREDWTKRIDAMFKE
jgi:uncharacterized protein YndB with AHSA1/START domain